MAKGKKGNGIYWTDSKKIEAVTTYLTVGNFPMTEAVTGVPRDTLRHWKMTEWWKDIARELQDQEQVEMSAKLKKIVDRSIEVVADRLENGDSFFDKKTGQLKKIPVKLRDALKASADMFDKRQVLLKQPTKIVEQRTVDDRLNKLAEEFARFSQARTIEQAPMEEIIDAS